MTYHYMVLGAGKQGTAAVYDLARFGDAARITVADMDEAAASQSADRVNALIDRPVVKAMQLNVTDDAALRGALADVDVVLSAVPYYFNIAITKAALATGTHVCDMGGNTEIVFEQLEIANQAAETGLSVVPDCGMMPGLANTMAAYLIAQFDEPWDIRIYDGGVPEFPQPPWNYALFFHINGLTNEYAGQTAFLRDHKLTYIDGLSEYEMLDVPGMGQMEACVTTGGVSTSSWTWEGKLRTYQNKTLRWPGHFKIFQGYRQLGLFSEEAIEVKGQKIVPRDVYHALLEPQIPLTDPRDVCVIHIQGYGIKDGVETAMQYNLIDKFDKETGFLAMERLTGWHCAIMMGFQARGKVKTGGVPVELAVPPADFMAELAKRGITAELVTG